MKNGYDVPTYLTRDSGGLKQWTGSGTKSIANIHMQYLCRSKTPNIRYFFRKTRKKRNKNGLNPTILVVRISDHAIDRSKRY